MRSAVTAVLLFVAGLARAQSTSTYTTDTCFTSYGTGESPSSISTVFNTTFTRGQAFARGTITPTSVLTPAPVTATSTQTVTSTSFVTRSTLSTQVGTAITTTTITVSSISTSISTFTSVGTVNVTLTNTATTIIPTQVGFTPVAAGVVAQGGIPSRRKRWQFKEPRDIMDLLRQEAPPPNSSSSRGSKCSFKVNEDRGGVDLFPTQNPTAVSCTRTVRVESTRFFYKTASSTVTITAQPSTSTTTITSTTTTTSSIGSDPTIARTTVTSSITTTALTTTTQVSTVSSTITNTVTVNAPTVTEYAACAANNTVSRVNGNSIIYGIQDLLVAIQAPTAIECCITCQTTMNCTTAAYYGDDGTCLLGNATGANANQFYTTGSAENADTIFTLSNGAQSLGNWLWEGLIDQPLKR